MEPGAPSLPFDFRRSIDLRLDAEGRWFHDGEPFLHAGLIAVFSRGIDVLPGTGEPILRVGTHWCHIRCDDTPFVVRAVRVAAEALSLTLNTEAVVYCRPEALRVNDAGLLYAELGPHRRARFGRGAQAAMADLLVTEETAATGVAVVLGQSRTPLARLT